MLTRPAVPFSSLAPDAIGMRPAGGRIPDTTRVGRVTLQVADLVRSLRFYREVIGFRDIDLLEINGQRVARLGAAGSDEVLLELREKPGVRPAPRSGRLGIYHFAVLLPERADLARFLRHALGRGARAGQADHLYSEATYLADPDGIEIEVYRDRPRDEWMVGADGQIIGSTEPLDLPSLAAAAGDEPWQGLPAGTTIGHMHFYVGDLERAERFYHAALGLDKVNWSFPGALFLSTGGYHHHVGVNTWAAGSRPSGDDDARLLSWELVTPDAASAIAAAERLRHAGFSVVSADGSFLASDPWGITVKLTAGEAITSS
jgi:catechol 2,3-dioxygenase